MATLLFTAIGTALGGPLGGALGALAGRQIDQMIIPAGQREGPRLVDLAVSTSSYGTPIARHFGRMRVAGSIIWATDLVEHRDRQGNGKGRPATVTYSYSVSFAVALSSRPVFGLGRIWADGKLLRGSAGDLKVGGTLRLYRGTGDQPPDPLIAAAEGVDRCPAFRGLAYAVFEDLQLGDFGNRIPALTFELLADEGALSVAQLLDGTLDDVTAPVPLDGLEGLSFDGPVDGVLASLVPFFGMDCDASGPLLTIASNQQPVISAHVAAPAVSTQDDDFAARTGTASSRSTSAADPVGVLRYYDIARDYQPGVQWTAAHAARGQPRTIDLPAALEAAAARDLIARAARQLDWSRSVVRWRCAQLDPAVRPGALVSLAGRPGRWRVDEWEWRPGGVELRLHRAAPPDGLAGDPADGGRANLPADQPIGATAMFACELPWDGSGTAADPVLRVAASSPSSNWTGAALYLDHGDGDLQPLGYSPRRRSVIGTALGALAPASPLLLDRDNTVIVQLIANDLSLEPARPRALAAGANRALLGEEIIQFAQAEPLGNGQWALSGLWRGRAGTEPGIVAHASGDHFILLDDTLTPLDPQQLGMVAPGAAIAALGLADPAPVVAPLMLLGQPRLPLAPVHGRASRDQSGALQISWIRRARGAWGWTTAGEPPLVEQSELYRLTLFDGVTQIVQWQAAEPQLLLSAESAQAVLAGTAAPHFQVTQLGDHGESRPLRILLD